MKLTSMTDFVLRLSKTNQIEINDDDWIKAVINYAKFLKQPLELWMFVPGDEDGNVLEEPIKLKQSKERWGTWEVTEEWKKYQQAKERVLFEINDLPEIDKLKKLIKGETVEMLADGTITLTQTAINQRFK